MKLFLASQANIVINKIVEYLPKKPEDTKLAYIITAANPNEDKDWVEENKKAFLNAGFKINEYDIAGKNKETLLGDLKDVDVIFVEGGETYYLLDQVRKSGFDEVIRDLLNKGVIYIGSSAGSIIMGPNIDIARRYDNPDFAPDLKDFSGLNLVNLVIVPHYNQKKTKDFLRLTIEDFKDKPYKLLLFSDNQFLVVVDNTYEVMEI